MPDRPDDDGLDSWLTERIAPLAPPPGTFDLIKRRARRRKYRRLAITATSAAVILAAAVTVPQVVNLPVLSPSSGAVAPAGQSSTATATGGGSVATAGATHAPTATSSAPPAPVPLNFRPTSVTFVGTATGWVIGQAGTPGQCATQYCTSVARTDNAGKTWIGVPAPLTGAPNGGTGVSQIRFLNLNEGWAFGPELFATRDSGHSWASVSTNGLRVTDLETVGHRAFALFASCQGTALASGCTSFTLYSAPAAGGAWTPVGAATTGLTNGAADEAASLTLTSSRGFLLAPSGALYAGPVDGSGPWKLVNSISPACPVGTPQADGQPSGALLGAVSARELILGCVTASGTGGAARKLIFSSLNGGGSWIPMAVAPTAGIATSIAASPSVSVVLATSQGIELLPAGDIAWQAASLAAPAPAGGFSYVGMTTDEQGIALPAGPSAGTVWFTFDGGKSWHPSSIKGS